ncbi:hypothetical protein [Lysinibacillus sp. TE18511]
MRTEPFLTSFSGCLLIESEAAGTSVLVAKVKRQVQKSPTSIGDEMKTGLS